MIEIAANAASATVIEIAATVNGKTRVADIMEIGTEIVTTEIAATGTGVNILETAIVITTGPRRRQRICTEDEDGDIHCRYR